MSQGFKDFRARSPRGDRTAYPRSLRVPVGERRPIAVDTTYKTGWGVVVGAATPGASANNVSAYPLEPHPAVHVDVPRRPSTPEPSHFVYPPPSPRYEEAPHRPLIPRPAPGEGPLPMASSSGRGRIFEAAPYSVEKYLALRCPNGHQYFDAKRYQRLKEYDPKDLANVNVVSPQGGFDTRWRHMGGRMAAKSACLIDSSLSYEMPYVRCREEVPWARRLRTIVWLFVQTDEVAI